MLGRTKRVTWHPQDGVPVIAIHGDFSDAIEQELITAYQQASQSKPDHLILQFDEEGHIYSTGLAILTSQIIREAARQGQRLHVVGLSEHFVEVFEFTGLTRYVTLSSSVQEVLASL